MKITQTLLCLTCTFLLLIGFQAFYPVPTPDNKEKELLDKANQFNQKFPQEKIYLHLDRPSYWSNDDIWFKAYLKNTPIPTCNLYVELLNERGKVVYKKTCWVQAGLAYGDIHLADTLSSGMYQIRAYTNWMRNFDEQWFFRRDLVIWNLRDKAKSPRQNELKARKVDFQFMPEGGTFLSGVKNKVAFKVIDPNGKGLDAEGVVLDEKGNPVATIKSLFKGMGSFEITPQPGMKYKAEVTVAGDLPLKVDLPPALVSGVTMNINLSDTNRIHIEINEQGGTVNKKYLVIGQSEGKVYYQGEVQINSGKGVMDISKEEFPTGIIRFTLFDNDTLPRCERLIFINHNDQIKLTIEPEQTEYHPRENVILDISALSKNELPVLANLSLSVYHTETTHQTETYPENILTRFLLSSELKGRIEEPAFYFIDDSLSTVLALDILMLTHGYRYFEWKEITRNQQPKISWQPEPSIQIKGTVYSSILHRPVPNGKVTMMTVKSLLNVREQKADSTGHFIFSDLFFNDTIQVAFQSRNQKGKALAEIELDERSSNSPEVSILPLMYQYSKESQSNTVSYMSELSPEFLNRKWHLSDTIMLGDVNVISRKKNKDDGHVRSYLAADKVIDVTKLDDVYSNIIETLEVNSPMFRSYSAKGAQIFLDGVPDLFGTVGERPTSWFDRVEFVRMAPIPGAGFGPGIFFYTKRGSPNEKPEWALGITATKLVGYSVIRNFYSPVYDGHEDQKNIKIDFRSLLYWNPNVNTDVEGLAWVSFYNSDQTGKVQVVAEGITKDGKLCRGIFNYNVVP